MRRVLCPRPWLTELRERKGMSIRELAIAADVHDNTIRYIENGVNTPLPETIVKIGRALDVPEKELIEKFVAEQFSRAAG